MNITYHSETIINNEYKHIIFKVSPNFNLPDFYKSCNETQLLHSFQLGSEICTIEQQFINEKSHEGAIGNILNDIKKKHISEIIRKDEITRKQLDDLNEELRCTKSELSSLQNDFSLRIKQQLDDTKSQHAVEIDRLRQLISELQDSRSSVAAETRAVVLNEVDSIQTAVLKEKDNMISYLREKETILTTKVDSLQELLISRTKNTSNAALSGRSGEDDFSLIMNEYGIELERTADESHMCDYKGILEDYMILFEVKNHKERILVKEITKFRRDMKEHPDIRCGIFIGLNVPFTRAGIDGIYGNGLFGIELTAEKQLLIYIGELIKNDIGWLLNISKTLISSICPLLEKLGETQNDTLNELENRIRTAVSCIQSMSERARLLYNKVVNDRKAADDAFVSSLSSIKIIREEIQMIIGVLLGNTVFIEDSSTNIIEEYDMTQSVILDSTTITETNSPKKRASGGGRKKKNI
jgi:hypothetical protein